MAININLKKKDGESNSSLIYRFTKKVMQSGVIRQAKGNRYYDRNVNRNKRRISALQRGKRKEEIKRAKRMGTFKT